MLSTPARIKPESRNYRATIVNRLINTPFAVLVMSPLASRSLWAVLYASHAAVGLVWAGVFGIGSWQAILVMMALAGHLVWLARRGGPGMTSGWVVQWHASGYWWLARGLDTPSLAVLAPGGCCLAEAVVLRLQSSIYGTVTLVLTTDNSPVEVRRRVRVRLLWPPKSPPSPSVGQPLEARPPSQVGLQQREHQVA